MWLFIYQFFFTALALTYALSQFSLTSCVIALLLTLIANGVTDQFDNRTCIYITTAVYSIAILFIPALGCLLPAFVFNSCILPSPSREKYPIYAATCMVCLFHYPHVPANSWFIYLFLCILAILNAKALCNIDALNRIICRNRDTDRELQILLEQKNATLLENTQYEIETATLRERNRIAREIHDNVGHLLTRSILMVGALNMINSNEQITPHLEQLGNTLNQAMDSIRSSVHNLHQTDLDLYTSLRTYLSTIDSLQINLEYEAKQIPREMSCHFLSIIKEAVHNTTKHSNADHVDIRLVEHPTFYQLSIQDNGTGTAFSASSPGMGLNSMQERVSLMNGSMEIFHEHGFRIFITVMK